MRPIYTFLNSEHLFYNETENEAVFAEYEITYKGKIITNYSFLDSKDDVLTQALDIIVGFVGKLSKFFNTHNATQIKQKVASMTPLQSKNLALYLDLVLKSERLNPGFFHYADSDDDHSKNQLLFQLRGKI